MPGGTGSFHLQNCRQRPVTAGSEPRVRISAEAGAGDLRIATLSGQISALVLSERKNGEDRELWIFVEDGYLRSASVKSGETVSAKDGKKITPLRSMDPRITGSDLLEISMRSESASAVCRVWIPGIGGGNE